MSPLGEPSVGIGWRPEISGVIDSLDGLQFCEVIAESLHGHGHRVHVPDSLRELLDRGVQVIPHGIGLSIGGAEPLDPGRVSHLARCAESLGSPLVSEHIAFVRADGIEAGHLLPVPRTRDCIDVLTEHIVQVQQELGVPFALENVAALFDWPDAEFTEAEFLAELVERTGVWLLLDIANVYANARNRGLDPFAELAAMPWERVAYCHVAGGHEAGGFYHDTHTDRVPQVVFDLVGTIPVRTPLLLEIDGNYPPAADILRELDALSEASGLPTITAGSRWKVP